MNSVCRLVVKLAYTHFRELMKPVGRFCDSGEVTTMHVTVNGP